MLPIGCRLQHPKSRSLALVGKYTGYSLRIGGACAVAASGGGLEVLRAIGGWSSDAVFTYIQTNSVSAKIGFGSTAGQA